MNTNSFYSPQSGFTLIELLVIIAIISILASITLTLINPSQTIKRARDIGAITNIGQCVNALETWHIRNAPNYPDSLDEMVPMKDLKVVPDDCRYYSRSSSGENAWIATTLTANPNTYKCPSNTKTVHYCYQTTTSSFGYICDGANVFDNNLDGVESCEAIADQATNGEWIPK